MSVCAQARSRREIAVNKRLGHKTGRPSRHAKTSVPVTRKPGAK